MDIHIRQNSPQLELDSVRDFIKEECRNLNSDNREELESATEQLVVVNALKFLNNNYRNYVVKISSYNLDLQVHISNTYIGSESLERGNDFIDSLGYVPYSLLERVQSKHLDFVNDSHGRSELVQLFLGADSGKYYIKLEEVLNLAYKLPQKTTKMKRSKI